MKKNVLPAIGLTIYGFLNIKFNSILLEKMIDIDNQTFFKLLDSINSIFNFIYPFLYYFFFLIIYNITLMFVLNKKDERINKNVIFFSMIPGFIFLCINTFYANSLNIEDIQQINNYQRAIVPFLSYSVSSVIAEICFIFPALSLFFYSYSKYNTYDSVVLSFTPVVLIYIFNLLI